MTVEMLGGQEPHHLDFRMRSWIAAVDDDPLIEDALKYFGGNWSDTSRAWNVS